MNSLVIIGLLVVILVVLLMKNGSFFSSGPDSSTVIDKGSLIVYGSKTCPWCVKQEDWLTKSGIDYTFVDCTKSQCPDFVKGFPTLLLDNEVMNGYTELGPQLSFPSPAKTWLPF
jgi:glutaredoxin